MNERYQRVFALEKNLYAENSPVIIAAGALLKDTQTGNVLAQLKFKSITNKRIKALTVCILAKDTVGRVLGEPVTYQFLDLSAKRNDEFGQKSAILLPDASTREFSVSVTEIAFEDNSVTTLPQETEWTVLVKQKDLSAAMQNNAELMKQYQIDINGDADYSFSEDCDLWFCSCGAINHSGESFCNCCNTSYEKQKSFDIDKLKENCEKRLEEERIKQMQRIAEQTKLEEEQRIIDEKARIKALKIFGIVCAIAAVCALLIVLTVNVFIPNAKYNAAKKLMNEEKYEEAIEAFLAMNGYKDSEKQLENCYSGKFGEKLWNEFKNLKAGDTYKFGSYEQDNNSSNGKEDIEWIVLDKNTNNNLSIMLISKFALDCQPYNNTKCTDITWEKCSLRTWLNNTFYNNAFSGDEKNRIPTTFVVAEKTEGSTYNTETSQFEKFYTEAGNDTYDKVFLLSISEAEKYFDSDEARKCAPTVYAEKCGAFSYESEYAITDSGKYACDWWLRSPGESQTDAASVHPCGFVVEYGSPVTFDWYAVRPAMWINIE